ncbi:unnamed protein product [Tilletia controversa]|nr:unnamed protein product [Tilletia controversa]
MSMTSSSTVILHPRAFDDSTDYTPNSTALHTLTDTISSSPRASWEQGTAAAAFLELYHPQWAVFAAADSHGPPYAPSTSTNNNKPPIPYKVLSMGLRAVATQDGIGRLSSRVTGDESTNAGSALDSASSGESVLIGAVVAGEINTADGSTRAGDWTTPAARQLAFLLNTVPRAANGAISHRFPDVQIWSDGVYMGPPFYAQYGLMTRNQTLLQLAYDQCRLYRDLLRITQGTSTNLWAHIWAATSQTNTTAPGFRWVDSNSWLTGNGWASAGMLRVAASIAQSPYANEMASQITDLTTWTREILEAAFPLADSNTGLFHNYANDSNTFLDSAGSSLLAYSAFRLASIGVLSESQSENVVRPAERIYQAVQGSVGTLGDMTNGLDVVNVLSFNSDSAHSSTESLSFLLLLSAARRDYAAGNVTGIRGPGTSGAGRHGKLQALGGDRGSAAAGGSSSTNAGAIAGALLGGLVAGILATLLALYCLRRRHRRRDADDEKWDNRTELRAGRRLGHHHRQQSSSVTMRNEKPGGNMNKTGSASSASSENTPRVGGVGVAAANEEKEEEVEDDDEPQTAVEMDNDKHTLWNNITGGGGKGAHRSNSLHRGVSFKAGTKSKSGAGAGADGGHRRGNTANSSSGSFAFGSGSSWKAKFGRGGGGGGSGGGGNSLSRAGSERRRDAIRAQEEARFDDDEMTVQEHVRNGRGGTEVPMVEIAPTPASASAPGAGGVGKAVGTTAAASAVAAVLRSGAQTPTTQPTAQPQPQAQSRSLSIDTGAGTGPGTGGVPMDRTSSSASSASARKFKAPRALPVAATPQPQQEQEAQPVPVPVSVDYFATPGAARADPATSTAPATSSSSAAVPVPDRATRHGRKPSSRAKALRSNRALIDGSAEQEAEQEAHVGVGAVMDIYSDLAMKAEEGAALKGRGRHSRSGSAASASASGSGGGRVRGGGGGHGRYASESSPVPVPSRQRLQEEEREARRLGESAQLARGGSSSSRSQAAPHLQQQQQQASSRTRSVERRTDGRSSGSNSNSNEEQGVRTTRSRTSSTPSSAIGAGGIASGGPSYSIRRVGPAASPGAGAGAGAGASTSGFASVGDVIAAGVQYPLAQPGVRTASTRTRGRVPSGSGAGVGARAGYL